jgi:predicted lipoprotein with Yx(FWY)xxD motif
VFDADPDYQTLCLDDLCRYAWPALVVPTRSVRVGPGLKASYFTTIRGHNGVRVVAVNGRALYLSIADKKPGTVLGVTADKVWHPVGPDGETIDG